MSELKPHLCSCGKRYATGAEMLSCAQGHSQTTNEELLKEAKFRFEEILAIGDLHPILRDATMSTLKKINGVVYAKTK